MSMLRNVLGGLQTLFGMKQAETEMDEELHAYLDATVKDKIRSGMSAEEALRAARVEMGSMEGVKEEIRAVGWEVVVETLFQDLRYAVRRLRQSPGFTLVCVLLALGIGANTAIFTLVDAMMLRSLPVVNPKQLWRVGNGNDCCEINGFPDSNSWDIYSYPLYLQIRDHTPEFNEMTAFSAALLSLSVRRRGASGPAGPYVGEFVSGNYFTTLGISASVGRTITAADDTAGAPPAAVMSYRPWQQHFSGDPSVIGATFTVNTVPYVVSGIAPPGFFGETLRSDPPDFWLPLGTEPQFHGSNSVLNEGDENWLYIIGRLKPGVQAPQLQSGLTLGLQHWLSSQTNIPSPERAQVPKQSIELVPAGGGVARLQAD